jgi:xanthine dehydrogenase large subunit
VLKRGLGLFPLKFGISFNLPHMNQAGALVHVYTDGSIRLNHGGTEMGQGLFIKVAQVVAEVFQVDVDRIRPSATSTAEVPNTSPTAASTGSDLNGWAAWDAANTIRSRMVAFAAEHFGVAEADIAFADGTVRIAKPGSNRVLTFGELARLCWLGRVSLSATGYYKTPKIHWDPVAMHGRPFFYFSFGAAMAEVAIDTLTGESRVLRADLVQGLRPVAQSRHRSRPDRGRVRAGPGLAHLRGTVVGRQGPAKNGGTVDLQDPRQPRRAAAVQREAARQCALARSHDLPFQGGSASRR